MKRTVVFFLLFVKRLCKKPSFLIILLLMPAMVLGLRLVLEKDDETVYVALYSEDEKTNQIVDELVNSEGAVAYYKAESARKLREDVLIKHAECGFVFSDGVWDAMIREEAEGMITIYQSTETTSSDLIKEEVFAEIYSFLSLDVLEYYLESREPEDGLTTGERHAYLEERYKIYLTEGGTFTISYPEGDETVVRDVSSVAADNSYLMKPVRGVLAVFVFMAAMAGAVFWAVDEKSGVYKTMGYSEKPFVNLSVVFIPTVFAGIIALISFFMAGVSQGFVNELFRMFVYCLLLTGYADIIRAFTSNAVTICALLPMMTVTSIVGCNIVVNIARYVAGVNYLRWFIPANYYLETAGNTAGCFITAGVGLVLIAAAVLIDRKKSC
ncbi:MAG: hypothetical protein ACI39R_05555 [Lachnospiraceae bacterium]